jgi:hypothetical protein
LEDFKVNRFSIPDLPFHHETLRQSIHNPFQFDRVTERSLLEIEYPTFFHSVRENLWYVARGIVRFAGCLLIITVLEYFLYKHRPAPYFHAVITITALNAFFLYYLWVLKRWTVAFVAAFFVPLLSLLLFTFPSPLLVSLAAALVLSLATDAMASNYFLLETAAPVLKPTSLKLRSAWRGRFLPWNLALGGAELYILPFAVASTGLLALALFCELAPPRAIFLRYAAFIAYFFFLFCLPLGMEVLFSFYKRRDPVLPLRLLPAVFHVFYQWLTYNRHNNRAPGIFQSPFGYYQFRQYALLAVTLLLSMAVIPYLNPDHARFVRHPEDELAAEPEREYSDFETFSPQKNTTAADLAPHQRRIYENLSPTEQADYLHSLDEQRRLAQERAHTPRPPRPAPTQQELRQTGTLAAVSGVFFYIASKLLLFSGPTLVTLATVFFFAYATTTRISARFDHEFHLEKPSVPLDHNTWQAVVKNLRLSRNVTEYYSIFVGLNAFDGTPVLVPRDVFKEHAHFLGDSGSGKTSLGLSPLIAQLIGFCDSTVIVLDLKGDDMALFENVRLEAKEATKRLKRVFPDEPHAGYPFRWITTDRSCSTFAFNPLTQPYFRSLTDDQRADLLISGLGMDHGTDYGRGFYTDANWHVLHRIFAETDWIDSFEQLAEVFRQDLKKIGVTADLRRAASHVQTHIDRLAAFDLLNVTPRNASAAVNQLAIDLCDLFRRPQALFVNLPVGQGAVSSAHVARLLIHSLISAAHYVGPRRKQVYLVIDEFQRIAAHNLKILLQTARSMNIAVILANQTLADLKHADTDLIPTIRTNTRFRQIFAASDLNDRKDIVDGSGEALFLQRAWNEHQDAKGLLSIRKSISFSEFIGPRLRQNQVLLATDHPNHSILEIRRGAGYAQYGGLPFVATSMFHISDIEYADRREAEWPEGVPGTLPDDTPPPPPTVVREPPLITYSESSPNNDTQPPINDIDDALDTLWGDKRPKKPPPNS